MPNPKHKHSKTRGRLRRTHWKLKNPALSICNHCKMPKIPHRICPHCGFYKGKQYIEGKEVI